MLIGRLPEWETQRKAFEVCDRSVRRSIAFVSWKRV